jgi:hypothetical protein
MRVRRNYEPRTVSMKRSDDDRGFEKSGLATKGILKEAPLHASFTVYEHPALKVTFLQLLRRSALAPD